MKNLDCGSGIQKLYTEYNRGNLLNSYHFEAGKRKIKDVSLLGLSVRVEDEWIRGSLSVACLTLAILNIQFLFLGN